MEMFRHGSRIVNREACSKILVVSILAAVEGYDQNIAHTQHFSGSNGSLSLYMIGALPMHVCHQTVPVLQTCVGRNDLIRGVLLNCTQRADVWKAAPFAVTSPATCKGTCGDMERAPVSATRSLPDM